MSSSLLDAARDRSTRYHKSVSESTRRSSSRGRKSSSNRRSSHRQSAQEQNGGDDEESGYNPNSVRTGVSRVSSHSTTGVDNNNNRREATEDYQLEEDHDDDDRTVDTKTGRATHPEAHYKQNYAPFSTTFCFVQCINLDLKVDLKQYLHYISRRTSGLRKTTRDSNSLARRQRSLAINTC